MLCHFSISTWIFVAAYLAAWAFAGLAAYVGMEAAEAAMVRVALTQPLRPKSVAQLSWWRVFTS
jgi:predicted metal-binding membrane protein